MSGGTKIEWTDETWNPTVGCSKVSPGCDNCYAIGVAHRQMQPAHEGLTIKRPGERPDWTGDVRCLPDRLDTPSRWKKPRRVFVDSMSDLFHGTVLAARSDGSIPDGGWGFDSTFLHDVFRTMALTPQHTYQILTKRPQTMKLWCEQAAAPVGFDRWPLPNVWLGTSIESNRYVFRADHLRNTPAAVRFLSLEPLLGPVPDLDLTDLDWVIVGGESGPGARPMHPDWVRSIRDRCIEAGVAFHFKQWGEWVPPDQVDSAGWDEVTLNESGATVDVVDGYVSHQGAHSCGASNTGVWRVGKKRAGRLLDGRTWDQYPEAEAS